MLLPCRILRLALPALLAASIPCLVLAPASTATAAAVATTAPAAPFLPIPALTGWPGTYDLLGHGFPDGERQAVAVIETRPGTSTLTLHLLAGPPGRLGAIRVDGDTLRVQWLVSADPGTAGVDDVLDLWLTARADSVFGRWALAHAGGEGAVEGRRRAP